MREPTLKKALEPYLSGLDRDINFDPTGSGISALFLAVLYSTKQGSFSPLEEDRIYAKKVVELLLEYGADPTRHEGNNPKYSTPLSAAKVLKDSDRDPEGIYELLLNHSLNSATEAAFENKFTGITKKVLGGVGKALKGLGKLGESGVNSITKAVGNLVGNKVEKALEKRDQKELSKVTEDIPDSYTVTNKNKVKPSAKHLDNDFSKLPESAKKRFIYENLSQMVSDENTDSSVRLKTAEILNKYSSPFSSDLYMAIKKVLKVLGKPSSNVKVWNILLNPKYEKLPENLKNTAGLSSKPDELAGQLAFIAYYLSKGDKLDSLKDESGWKSLYRMKKTFSEKPKKDSLTGREIVIGALNKKGTTLTKEDALKFISAKVLGGDESKARALLSNEPDSIGKVLDKKFSKNFDDDDLQAKLIDSLSSLVRTEEPEKEAETKPESLTGREIILEASGEKGPNLAKDVGIDYLANSLFNGDKEKAGKFFEDNRKSISQALNRKYEKTFEEDNLSELFVSDLKEVLQGSKKPKKSNIQLNDEQKQAALALQSLGYSKTASTSMVRGKQGDSSQIVYEALKSQGGKSK